MEVDVHWLFARLRHGISDGRCLARRRLGGSGVAFDLTPGVYRSYVRTAGIKEPVCRGGFLRISHNDSGQGGCVTAERAGP